ncbi:2-phosphoxylose phosphatase 1, partial [Sarracenia purpurea var. burkii]
MIHVRNLNLITCGYSDDVNVTELYSEYLTFMSNNWSNQVSTSLFQFLGQPNNHPAMPSSKQCDIGQLSLQGVMQHLKLGSILRTLYFEKLFAGTTQIHTNVIAYTTKYRRTFQSLNAFLFGFLKSDGFLKIPLNTVTSMSYCFEDCACPAKERYYKNAITENNKRIRSNSDVLRMVEDVSSVVYTFADGSFIRDPHYLKDALMAYLCHNTHLPCLATKCVYPLQALKVFSYVDWDSRQLGKSIPRQKYCILSSYGFIKIIVSHLLKIVSNEKPKVVLYSAHDKTIQFLLTALGITLNEAVFPPYASRVIFE